MSLHEYNSIFWVCLTDKNPQNLLSLFYCNEGPANAFREANSPKLAQDEVCHRQPLPLLIQALFFLKQWLLSLTTHLFRVELGQRKVSRSVSQVQSNICEKKLHDKHIFYCYEVNSLWKLKYKRLFNIYWAMHTEFSALFYKHNIDYDLKYLLLSW